MSLAHSRHLPQEILEPWEGFVLTVPITIGSFKILRWQRHLKSAFAFFETSARLTQLAHFVKCGQTLLEVNSSETRPSSETTFVCLLSR